MSALHLPPHTHTVFPHQCPPTTVHRSLSPTTNANILTALFTYLPLPPPSSPPSVQHAKWAEGGCPAPPGTIFIVISRNSPGFIWKLERACSWAASFQDPDVTALARARSLIGVGDVQSVTCVLQRQRGVCASDGLFPWHQHGATRQKQEPTTAKVNVFVSRASS